MGLFGPPNIEKMKAKRDVEGLIKALANREDREDYRLPLMAARALGQIGDAHAVEPLIAALKDIIWEVRAEAQGARRQIREAYAGAVSHALHKLEEEKMVNALSKLEEEKVIKVGTELADALAKIGTPAVEPLIAALRHGKRDVQDAAAGALA
jgi:HEAT repeat protein